MKKIVTSLLLATAISSAHADIIFGDTFTPDATETFEGTAGDRTILTTIFDGDVVVTSGSVDFTTISEGDWTDFRTSDLIVPVSGTIFGTLYGFGDITLDFTSLGGITGFSFWASAAGIGDDAVTLYDVDGNVMAGYTNVGGFGENGIMEFVTLVSSELIGFVELDGQETAFDDISYAVSAGMPQTPVSEPATLALLALGVAGVAARRKKAK